MFTEEPFILAVLWLPPLLSRFPQQGMEGEKHQELAQFIRESLHPLTHYYRIAARLQYQAEETLAVTWRIRQGNGTEHLMRREVFSLALDLFKLWCRATGDGKDIANS